MSYSFNIRAANLAAAAAAVSAELDKVADAQPIHQRDRTVTDQTVAGMLALKAEPGEGEELSVNVAGSCWTLAEGEAFQGITLSVSIHTHPKTS